MRTEPAGRTGRDLVSLSTNLQLDKWQSRLDAPIRLRYHANNRNGLSQGCGCVPTANCRHPYLLERLALQLGRVACCTARAPDAAGFALLERGCAAPVCSSSRRIPLRALASDKIAYGNGEGSAIELRSRTAIPSLFAPVMAINTLSSPSETSASSLSESAKGKAMRWSRFPTCPSKISSPFVVG